MLKLGKFLVKAEDQNNCKINNYINLYTCKYLS